MYLKGGARNPLEYKKTKLEGVSLSLFVKYFVLTDFFTPIKIVKSKIVDEKFVSN